MIASSVNTYFRENDCNRHEVLAKLQGTISPILAKHEFSPCACIQEGVTFVRAFYASLLALFTYSPMTSSCVGNTFNGKQIFHSNLSNQDPHKIQTGFVHIVVVLWRP